MSAPSRRIRLLRARRFAAEFCAFAAGVWVIVFLFFWVLP